MLDQMCDGRHVVKHLGLVQMVISGCSGVWTRSRYRMPIRTISFFIWHQEQKDDDGAIAWFSQIN